MRVIAALLMAFSGLGQDFDQVEIKTQKLTDGAYVLFGAGGNIGVNIGDDGVILIDDQFAPLTDKIRAAVLKISDKPIKFVINTHWHGDHTGGNENLGKTGSLIVAQDRVRVRMAKGAFIEAFNRQIDPAPPVALPVVTFSDQLSLHVNGGSIRAHHVENAHTDGDSLIHLETLNILHMGDTFFNNRLPFVDLGSGGTIDGVIAAAEKAQSLVDKDTIIIPGHGPLARLSDLRAYHAMLLDARARIAKRKAAGLSLQALIAERPLDDLPERYLAAGPGWTDRFVGFVFNSID